MIGIISGLLGAIFIGTTIRTGALRKKYVNSNWKKTLEVVVFCFVTVSVLYVVVVARQHNCYPIDN